MKGVGDVSGVHEEILRYMHDKYTGDTFSFDFDTKWIYEESWLLKSKKFPDGGIGVSYGNYGGDGKEYEDNYLDVKYRKQLRKKLRGIATEVLGHGYELYHGKGYSFEKNDFSSDTTFDEYLTNDRTSPGFIAVVKPGYDYAVRERFEDKFIEVFTAQNMKGIWAEIYFAPSVGVFKEMKSELRSDDFIAYDWMRIPSVEVFVYDDDGLAFDFNWE